MDRDESRSHAGGAAHPGLALLRKRIFAGAKVLALALLAWVLVCVVTVSSIEIGCSRKTSSSLPALPDTELARLTADLPEYGRPEEDTYLSYPEWYIVWSYQEKAAFQRSHLPSGFSYFGGIGQYWSGYCGVNRLVQGRYAFNAGDHLMLVVIGTSFTLEYALKSLYENTVGRISEWLSGNQPVEEDRYAYAVAQRYADFVLVRPFYEYSFSKELAGLWTETHLVGPHLARKWERKLFLTYDYAVEAFYCELIEIATRLTFGVAGTDTYARIDNASDSVFVAHPHIRRVKPIGRTSYIVIIPRYQEFTPTAISLAHAGVRFRDIAGNREIVISVIAPRSFTYDLNDGEILFSSDVPTNPALKRLVCRTSVPSLPALLAALRQRRLTVEHIYDY